MRKPAQVRAQMKAAAQMSADNKISKLIVDVQKAIDEKLEQQEEMDAKLDILSEEVINLNKVLDILKEL